MWHLLKAVSQSWWSCLIWRRQIWCAYCPEAKISSIAYHHKGLSWSYYLLQVASNEWEWAQLACRKGWHGFEHAAKGNCSTFLTRMLSGQAEISHHICLHAETQSWVLKYADAAMLQMWSQSVMIVRIWTPFAHAALCLSNWVLRAKMHCSLVLLIWRHNVYQHIATYVSSAQPWYITLSVSHTLLITHWEGFKPLRTGSLAHMKCTSSIVQNML